MAYFPLFIDVEQKDVLVVGSGTVAIHKIEKLLPYGARITAIAPFFDSRFDSLPVKKIQKEIQSEDITSSFLFVIAATGDGTLNQTISRICQKRRIFVNVVDDKELCTFLFPSLVRQGEIVCGITSSGNSPLLSQKIRKEIETHIPAYVNDINVRMGELRVVVKERVPANKRKIVFSRILERLIFDENQTGDEEVQKIIEECL